MAHKKTMKKAKRRSKANRVRNSKVSDTPLHGSVHPGDVPIGRHATTRVVGKHKDQKRDKLGRWV